MRTRSSDGRVRNRKGLALVRFLGLKGIRGVSRVREAMGMLSISASVTAGGAASAGEDGSSTAEESVVVSEAGAFFAAGAEMTRTRCPKGRDGAEPREARRAMAAGVRKDCVSNLTRRELRK